MKLEVGMYVKFKTLSNQVKLGQIQLIDNSIYELDNNEVTADKYIVKASHNIIDLIEEGDYVNGSKVQEIGEGYVEIEEYSGLNNDMPFVVKTEDIKSIVTKEQFESMKYSLEG